MICNQQLGLHDTITMATTEIPKGKCVYIALFFVVPGYLTLQALIGMDHTVLPAITPMPTFTS